MAKTPPKRPRPETEPVDRTDHAHDPDSQEGVHPAAAPLGTDAEAGQTGPRPAKGGHNAPKDAADARREVRVVPGDAGQQSAPRVLDDPRDKGARSGRGLFIAGLIAGPLLIIVLWIFLA